MLVIGYWSIIDELLSCDELDTLNGGAAIVSRVTDADRKTFSPADFSLDFLVRRVGAIISSIAASSVFRAAADRIDEAE